MRRLIIDNGFISAIMFGEGFSLWNSNLSTFFPASTSIEIINTTWKKAF
jgi:hypothetical protein